MATVAQRSSLQKAVAATVTEANGDEQGDTQTIGPWKIEAIPMYNLQQPSDLYRRCHREHSRDALQNIDGAFVPMNLPYSMTTQEAADAVRAFKPKIVYPVPLHGIRYECVRNGAARFDD